MLQLKKLSLAPESKIVPAEEYQACLDAAKVIQAAEAQAQQIVADAQAEYEAEKKRGYEDGLIEGQMEMAEKMIDSVTKSVDYFSDLESKVVGLVTKSLRKIVGDIDADERIVAIVRHSLAVVRNQPKITVRVCPDETAVLESRLTQIMKPYPAINYIDVVSDSRLESGGCILETEIGVVDASVDVQLKAIEQAFAKSLAGED